MAAAPVETVYNGDRSTIRMIMNYTINSRQLVVPV